MSREVDQAANYLHQLKEEFEGLSSNEEEVEEVSQFEFPILIVEATPTPVLVAPVLVINFGSEAMNDLDFPLVHLVFRDLIKHLFIKGGGVATSSNEVYMAPNPKDIGPKKGKRVAPQIIQVPTPVQDLVPTLTLESALPSKRASLPSSQKLKWHKGWPLRLVPRRGGNKEER